MARGRARQVLFRIFYSTSFTIVFLLTVAFACAGPTDMIYQSYRRRRWIDMFIIAGIYLLTGIIAAFLYASRLYTNRSILKDIPKTYMPIDKSELPAKKVWRLIEDCKNRSAVIAYLARPRAKRVEIEVSYTQERIRTLLKPEHTKDYHTFEPKWGVISHPGWSSPAAKETPNLNYNTVVAELTDLIEARAVSLAPTQSSTPQQDLDAPTPAEDILLALRRPEESGMRQYVAQLVSLAVLENNSLTVAFLTLYERARFAPDPLSEDEFKSLMRMFAEILRSMKPLDTSLLDLDDSSSTSSDDQNFLPPSELDRQGLAIRSEPFANRAAMTSSSTIASSLADSVRRQRFTHPEGRPSVAIPSFISESNDTAPPRISNDSVRSLSSYDEAYTDAGADADRDTSWAQPTSRPPFLSASTGGSGNDNVHSNGNRRGTTLRRTPSRRSVASNRTGKSSMLSLRSRASGSVIRLNRDFDGSRDQLPYEYITTTEV